MIPFPYGPGGYMTGLPILVRLVSDIAQARVAVGSAVANSALDYVNTMYAWQPSQYGPSQYGPSQYAWQQPQAGRPAQPSPRRADPFGVNVGQRGAWGWQPTRVSFIESDDSYTAYVELPNMEPADVSVKIDGSQVQVFHGAAGSAELTATVAIPDGVDIDSISADFRDGVLQISVRKDSKHVRRDVKVQTAGRRTKESPSA